MKSATNVHNAPEKSVVVAIADVSGQNKKYVFKDHEHVMQRTSFIEANPTLSMTTGWFANTSTNSILSVMICWCALVANGPDRLGLFEEKTRTSQSLRGSLSRNNGTSLLSQKKRTSQSLRGSLFPRPSR